MYYETIKLNEYFLQLPKTEGFEPTLTAYCPGNSPEIDLKRKRASILICPGGGYEFTSDREAEPVALKFLSLGYNAFVLRYSVAPERYPTALLQVSAAVALIRRQAEKFNSDIDQIAVCGFSAGAHLACCQGIFWNEPFLSETLHIEKGLNRPNAMILAYPVITSGEYAHEGSFECLLGNDAPQELKNKLSLENQVNKDVPPTFLWHTFNDQSVPVENSLLFANALRSHNIPFELHIYPEGSHGLSLCNHETADTDSLVNPHCGTWVSLCDEWLKLVFKAN
jgi:acetyl esterase/lipase